MEKFRALGLSERTITALQKKGFEEPSEVQALTIPHLLTGTRDVIAQAQTGTGKTAAFSLPIIERIDPTQPKVQAIILAPTRELVVQVMEEINSLKGDHDLRVAAIYGGQSYERQFSQLERGVSIVVGTPGRVMDHLKRGSLKLDDLKFFILDEADEMLNMGFVDDIEEILEKTPETKQMLLFSATMPQRIKYLAEKYCNEPMYLKTKQELTTNLTDQIYYEVHKRDKFEALCRIIDIEKDFYSIIFCRTKNEVDEITHHLNDRGFPCDALHGDITQMMRERILLKFRKKQLTILVATDVAARGIDVTDLTHVINYSLPQNAEAYTHRIGRTGRAGKQGTAITFITPSEFRKLGFIKKITKADIRKEKVPHVKDIIKEQQKQITETLRALTDETDIERFREWANFLLEHEEPSDLVAALLTHSFGKKLNEKNYREISPVTFGGDRGGFDRGNDRGGFDRGNDRGGDRRYDRKPSGSYSSDRGDRGNDRGQWNDRKPAGEFRGNDRFERKDRPADDRFPRKEGSDRPRFDRDSRPSGDRPSGGDRFPRREGGDRLSGDRPRFDRDTRPSGDRPSGGDRFPRKEGGERPARVDRPSGDRFERKDRDSKFEKKDLGDRPTRVDRPARVDRKLEDTFSGGFGGDRTPVDESGRTRLFVAQGKDNGYNSKKLTKMVALKAGVEFDSIQSVNVRENYSFITVPFADAEKILNSFRSVKLDGKKPLIEKADPSQQ